MKKTPTSPPAAVLTPLFKAAVAPLRAFFKLEAASGIMLLAAAAAAMVFANTSLGLFYASIFTRKITLGFAGLSTSFSLHALINDGLMSIFFFVVGMEIKRELVLGELRTFSRALLPAVAAAGGMVVPAAVYLLFNAGGPGAKGWAIPMATDIAFAIGCLALLKGRVSHGLLVFLTALAIFDDMGGILVIALFYGHGLHLPWFGAVAAVMVALLIAGRARVKSGLVYAVLGALLWYSVHHAGIHATIAGVLLGLFIPAREARPAKQVIAELHTFTGELVRRNSEENVANEEILQIEERLEDLEPPLNRFVHLLHPWVGYVIMPLFAFANSGINVSGTSSAQLLQPIFLGSALGLFFGKQIGIFVFTLIALKLKIAARPAATTTFHIYGVATVAGIGFTVALFIAGLAFAEEAALLNQAKLGILCGSLLAGVTGWLLLRFAPRPPVVAAVKL